MKQCRYKVKKSAGGVVSCHRSKKAARREFDRLVRNWLKRHTGGRGRQPYWIE